jgi:hypothetical protein
LDVRYGAETGVGDSDSRRIDGSVWKELGVTYGLVRRADQIQRRVDGAVHHGVERVEDLRRSWTVREPPRRIVRAIEKSMMRVGHRPR